MSSATGARSGIKVASSSASLALAAQETLRKPATAAVAPKGKFHALSDRFQGFEEELHLTRDKKTVDEQKRLNELEIKMNHLNSALALEANNRAQSLAALQAVRKTVGRPVVKLCCSG